MAQEFNEDNGIAHSWTDKTIGHELQLNRDRRNFVYEMIELIDANSTQLNRAIHKS